VKNNAAVGAQIAVALEQVRRKDRGRHCAAALTHNGSFQTSGEWQPTPTTQQTQELERGQQQQQQQHPRIQHEQELRPKGWSGNGNSVDRPVILGGALIDILAYGVG